MRVSRPLRLIRQLAPAALFAVCLYCGPLDGPFALCLRSTALADEPESNPTHKGSMGIRHVDLIHFSHTDVGFTDHPDVCREMQKRYLDIAIDAVLATRDKPPAARFCWTTEATLSVDDWWRSASAQRREDFLQAVDSGQLCISGLAMNNMSLLGREEWHKMVHWLPEDLWRRVRPEVALQDDVNGFPRAGATELLDRGITRLFTGINEDNGGAPFKRPSAFWWRMPDGRRLFVYLSFAYSAGHFFFDPVEWRRGPVPQAGDTRYRPPRAGDFLGSDEASVRKAHGHLLERIRGLETHGYHYPVLLLSTTNQWRIDNDPPFPPLAQFVATWNRLKLEPTLRLTTASVAMKYLEDTIGDQIPEYQGEWTDWWANGAASAPREVAASRVAKRLLQAADSPLWGPWTDGGRRIVDQSLRELCLFDEHTWGSSDSIAKPYSLDTQGQFGRKASLAYRPLAFAEWLLGERVRSRLATEGEGVYVANSSPLAWSGWVRMPRFALRDEFQLLEDPETGAKAKLYFENGYRPFTPPRNPSEVSRENTSATFGDNCRGRTVKFWVERLPGQSIRRLRLCTKEADEDSPPAPPTVTMDQHGWPTAITWPGMTKPLFLPGLGDFVAVRVKGFAPRWVAKKIFYTTDAKAREKLREESLEETTAVAKDQAAARDDPHTIVYTQAIDHPRLLWATRQLEVWKGEPRARFTLRFYRISSESPEKFYVAFPLPCEGVMPETSCGGVPFTPFRDQLPGTCRDYFAIDGWIHFATPAGHWLWVSHDAPLVTFGGPQTLARRTDPPQETNRDTGHDLRQFLVHQFRRRQPRRDGVPLRSGLAERFAGVRIGGRPGPDADVGATSVDQSRA